MSNVDLLPVERLKRDILNAARLLTDTEARYLVDAFYMMQGDRMRRSNQVRSLDASGEPNLVISWFAEQSSTLEKQIQNALDRYTKAHLMGSWMREIYGIGPILSAGLLAHIDIERAPTAGHIWQFAGISGDNQRPWNKGERRPWNAKLKTLCWKIGQSFMKLHNSKECYYGKIYEARKEFETQHNALGNYATIAAKRALTVGKSTEAYKHYSVGRLPPAHIDARARRYAVKLFLSHLHEEWFRRHFKTEPPKPYPIAFGGHVHYISPPPPSQKA